MAHSKTGSFKCSALDELGNTIILATSASSQKFVAYIGELSAAMARRADDGISGIFRGGPTPPASSRAAKICDEFLGRDTSFGGLKPDTPH